MKRLFSIFCLITCFILSTKAINLKVGDTYTCDIGYVSNLKGTQWVCSRPYDIVFTSSPTSYTTKVEVKAVKSFSGPCAVQCTYYYYDLDPVTGRYTYLRSDYKAWTFYVDGTGSDDDQGKYTGITLSDYSKRIKVGQWFDLKASTDGTVSWRSDDVNVLTFINDGMYNTITVHGEGVGKASIIATNSYGNQSSCVVVVDEDNDPEYHNVNETFTAYENYGKEITYKVLSNDPKTCQVGDGKKGAVSYFGSDIVLIPSNARGYEVVAIGNHAFNKCDNKTIILPQTLKNIGDYAFEDLLNVKTLYIPQSVNSIGIYAFSGCNKLELINIPEEIDEIKAGTFAGCNFQEITIPNKVVKIGSYAFEWCDKLKTITIPKSVKEIENSAFSHCLKLWNIVLSEGLKEIGVYAFQDCGSLTTISLPSTVKMIGGSAFRDCDKLSSIYVKSKLPCEVAENAFGTNSKIYQNATLYVPTGTKEIYASTAGWKKFKNIVESGEELGPNDGDLFTANTAEGVKMTFKIVSAKDKTCQVDYGETEGNLRSSINQRYDGAITIPDIVNDFKVIGISAYAFYECRKLTKVSIPQGVQYIGSNAFNDCTELVSVNLPDGIEVIKNSTFRWCEKLNAIQIPKSVKMIEEFAFFNCYKLGSAIIPENITFIGESAFRGCGLKQVELPKSIVTIKKSAFEYNKIKEISLPANLSEIGKDAFDFRTDSLTIISNIIEPFEIPNILGYYSNKFYKEGTLYVPKGTKSKYETTTGWDKFENIVEFNPAGINGVRVDESKDERIFDLYGRRLEQPRKGPNIIGGKKVFVK